MWWYLLFLPLAVLLWLVYEWIEHSFVQYNSTVVDLQAMPAHTTLKLCLISDLHNNKKNLAKLVRRIGQFQPDAVLLAGDLVNKHDVANRRAEEFLFALHSLAVPVYYSAGNHELTWSEKDSAAWKQYLDTVSEYAIYLDNCCVPLKSNPDIYLSGLSLPWEFYKKGSLCNDDSGLPEFDVPPDGIHILMAHNPEYVAYYAKYHPDLIVSGHLHGGLLRLPFIGGVVSPRLRLPVCRDAGLTKLSETSKLFVSRGLGSHTIPLRFFNRVEVNFLILKKTEL